jgi:hypothetical protein
MSTLGLQKSVRAWLSLHYAHFKTTVAVKLSNRSDDKVILKQMNIESQLADQSYSKPGMNTTLRIILMFCNFWLKVL